MLPCYVRSFAPIDEQLESGLLPQSVVQSGAAGGQSAEQLISQLIQLAVHERGVAILTPGESL